MCYDDNARPPEPPGSARATQSQDLVLTAADGNQFAAFLALPEQPARAHVLIFPDIRGLHQFYKSLAVRLAEQGIAAIAMDYFGRTAGLTSRDDSFEFMPHVQQLTLEGTFADATAALAQLRASGGSEHPQFSLGFCLGGTFSFLAGMEPLDLTGVIAFYAGMARSIGGRGTLLERATELRLPALGLFGGADQGIPTEQVHTLDTALDGTGVEHEIVIYSGAPHSFFDRRATEFAEASADAWQRVLGFIDAHGGAQSRA